MQNSNAFPYATQNYKMIVFVINKWDVLLFNEEYVLRTIYESRLFKDLVRLHVIKWTVLSLGWLLRLIAILCRFLTQDKNAIMNEIVWRSQINLHQVTICFLFLQECVRKNMNSWSYSHMILYSFYQQNN